MMGRGFTVPENTYNYPIKNIKDPPCSSHIYVITSTPATLLRFDAQFLEMKSEV